VRRGGCPTRPVGGLSLKRFLVFVSQLIATAIVTWFIANQAGLSLAALRSLDVSSWRPSAVRVAVSCVALFGGYVASGWLWGLIVRGLGGPRLPGAVSVRLFMVANLGRYLPGKVWQIASLVALGRARGVSAGTATAAAVLGQGIGLGSATLLGLGALWPMADGAAWRWLLPLTLLAAPAVGLTPPVFRALSSLEQLRALIHRGQIPLLITLAQATRHAPVLRQRPAELVPDHSRGNRPLPPGQSVQKVGHPGKGVCPVEIICIQNSKRPLDAALRRQHGMGRAPRFFTPLRHRKPGW